MHCAVLANTYPTPGISKTTVSEAELVPYLTAQLAEQKKVDQTTIGGGGAVIASAISMLPNQSLIPRDGSLSGNHAHGLDFQIVLSPDAHGKKLQKHKKNQIAGKGASSGPVTPIARH